MAAPVCIFTRLAPAPLRRAFDDKTMSGKSINRGPMPVWRLALWVLLAMAGVWYFTKPDSEAHRYVRWVCIPCAGFVLFGMGAMLNWIARDRVRACGWLMERAGILRVILLVSMSGSILVTLWGLIFHKR
jgi:hypothetical protein